MNKQEYSLIEFAERHMDGFLSAWREADGNSSVDISYDYQKLDAITGLVISGLGRFSGSNVLDIGCNSGLHSLLVSSVAKSVTGCDQQELFINRAKKAKAYLDGNYIQTSSLRFAISDFREQLNPDIDSIIANRILYHLSDESVDFLADFIRRNVSKMMIQCRPKRDIVYSGRDICQTKRYNGLYKVHDCVNFLVDCRFTELDVWGLRELWNNGENFPVIFARKGR